MRSIEVSRPELMEIAASSGSPIELPGDRAGWARVTVPSGGRFHAFVLAPEARAAS